MRDRSFSGKSEQCQLGVRFRQRIQIGKDRLRLVQDAVLLADRMKQRHERRVIRAHDLVGVAVGIRIAGAKPREMPVERGIEVFAVPLPQRHADAEAHDALHSGFDAVPQQTEEVFLRVVDEGQKGRQPHDRRDAGITHGTEHLEAARGRADIGLEDAAEAFVAGRQRHLHDCLRLPVDMRQQFNVPQHQIGFCQHCSPEAVGINQFKASARQAKLLLDRHIGVTHRAGADHASAAFPSEGFREQLRCVRLDGDILKGHGRQVAFAAAVAVDAAVRAAAVEIHAVFCGQNRFRLDLMHMPPPFRMRSVCKTKLPRKTAWEL